MSTDFSIKPMGAPVPPAPVKPISQAVNSAVLTELPPSQIVTATDTSATLRNDPQSVNPDLSHQVLVDRDASAIVYQVVNELTGAVVNQFPDDASLRRRAYFHTLDVMKTEQSELPRTVRSA